LIDLVEKIDYDAIIRRARRVEEFLAKYHININEESLSLAKERAFELAKVIGVSTEELQRNEARDPASNIGSLVNQIYKKSEKQLRSQSQATPPRNTAIPEGFGSPPKKELKSPHKKDPSSSVGQPATPEREKRKKTK
jgi:hypothetical protein